MLKKYVIVKIGSRHVLKEKINDNLFGAALFASRNLQIVKDFAQGKSLNVVAIGDIYEV